MVYILYIYIYIYILIYYGDIPIVRRSDNRTTIDEDNSSVMKITLV